MRNHYELKTVLKVMGWLLIIMVLPAGAAQTTFVPAGSVWKYLDDGSNQGTAWYGTGFNDNAWASGAAQLGYGDGDEVTVVNSGPTANKYITTYFRHTFNVPDASIYQNMLLEVLRDDGAVVYLNGTEIFRTNMPGGAIDYLTIASTTIGGAAENTFYNITIDANTLVDGNNVLATEIHQISGTSSDISFDLHLIGSTDGTFATIVRKPYLQNGTTEGVTILWRTNANVSSKVWYGTSLGSLNQTVTDANLETDHTIQISGLPSASKYFYQVGMTDETVLAGGNANHYFVTSPIAGSTEPVRIWVLGDCGTANSNAIAVKNAYLELADNEKEADIWLMLGDNAYLDGTDAQYQNAVFNIYPEILRNKVLWSTRGNHEKDTSVYYGIFDFPTQGEGGGLASGTEHYYSFDYANIHFICLNSEETTLSSDPFSAMYLWLEQDLADTMQEWIIAFWHHPPYTKGSHDSDNSSDSGGRLVYMRENALSILEAGGVDLVLTGHSHSYERSYFLNGHYGYSGSFDLNTHVVQAGDGKEDGDGAYQRKCGNDGTVYIVGGSSGMTSGGSLNHPAMIVSLSSLGSIIIDANDTRLDVFFLRENTGPTQIDDYLTIETKGCNIASNPDPAHEELQVPVDANLSWTPGNRAASHRIYFGTDQAAVTDAIYPLGDVDANGVVDFYDLAVVVDWWMLDPTGSVPYADISCEGNVDILDFALIANDWREDVCDIDVYKGNQARDSNTYDPPGDFTQGTHYYWRIDEVNDCNIWKGDVWQFKSFTRTR